MMKEKFLCCINLFNTVGVGPSGELSQRFRTGSYYGIANVYITTIFYFKVKLNKERQ